MNVLRLLPVILSFLLLAAHFYRGGELLLVGISLLLPFLLLVRNEWVPRMVQVVLFIGALEWLFTAMNIAETRMQFALPWTRMAVILGTVALFTALSGLVFNSAALRERYSLRRR